MNDQGDIMQARVAKLSRLEKRLGNKKVLAGVDLDLAPGSVVGLLGRNGAGKTTLIQCLLGLQDCDAGHAEIFGEPASSLSVGAKARIGYVSQTSELFEWMTPKEMLDYVALYYPTWNHAKVEGLLSRWAIDTTQLISKLSMGEKQRLAIVRALAHDPDFLVLDEPVASLDPAARRDFLRELVTGTLERQTTVLFSTHILSDLERIAMDIAILHEGRVVLNGSFDELADAVVRLTGPIEALQPHLGLALAAAAPAGEGLQSFIARLNPDMPRPNGAVRVDRLTMEDLFIEVTR